MCDCAEEGNDFLCEGCPQTCRCPNDDDDAIKDCPNGVTKIDNCKCINDGK